MNNSEHTSRVNRHADPQLTWMINEEETHLVHFCFPLHIEILLTEMPMYKAIVYFNTEELAEVSFRTNPAESIMMQHKLASLCMEEIISNICDAVKWQSEMREFYLHCEKHRMPQPDAIHKFENAKINLFGQIHKWVNTFDESNDE